MRYEVPHGRKQAALSRRTRRPDEQNPGGYQEPEEDEPGSREAHPTHGQGVRRAPEEPREEQEGFRHPGPRSKTGCPGEARRLSEKRKGRARREGDEASLV